MIVRTAVLLLFYSALVLCLIPLLFLAMPFGIREPLVNLGKWAMRASRIILGLRVDVEGRDQAPGAGPFVYMSNHLSLLDGPLLYMLIRRPVRVILKSSIFRLPVVGFGMRYVGFVPVDRRGTNGGRAAIARAAVMMKEKGYSFLVFPEGTRSRTGELQAFRRGGFFLARTADAPIVPVSIRGTFKLMPKGKIIPRKGTIRVVFHPPVSAPESGTGDLGAWVNAVRERILSVPD
ncbi:MAG: lysophospholipid acyltransferase family protein [Candidatus Aminicenantes bacterium]|nr:lysophospholipid acyltransferase family protein [Candidatus Aminicenantes bacterium]